MLRLSKMFKNYSSFVALLSAILTHSSGMVLRQRNFHLALNPQRGPIRLSSPWIETSLASCVNSCMSRYADGCLAFIFNPLTGLCTPGSSIGGTTLKPTPSEGNLFHSYCDGYKGFRVVNKGATIVCVAVFTNANYFVADASCSSKGSFLMSVKTAERMAILLQVVGIGTDAWVGCDALVNNKVYVWKDDGSVLTGKTISDNFIPGDPNYLDTEHCVILMGTWGKLNDFNCATTAAYVCEKALP